MSCTLKDVAKRANVSIVTVHKCIYGKPGISEDTRKRVLALVEEMHYAVNPTAAALKRDTLHIAAVFPCMAPHLNDFYNRLVAGAKKAEGELRSLSCHVHIISGGSNWKSQQETLEQLLTWKELHGVVTYCLDESKLNETLKKFQIAQIPVVTVNADAPDSGRLACVAANACRMGELAAELLLKMDRAHKRILIVGGDKRLSILRDNTTSFYSYIQQNMPEISLLEINNTSRSNLKEELEKVLVSLDDVTGIYCSMTRNAKPVCETIEKLGCSDSIRLVCTDVFQELAPYLKTGVVDATIWQNPQLQSYNALMLMYNYLVEGKLQESYFQIPICPVLYSNYEYFL